MIIGCLLCTAEGTILLSLARVQSLKTLTEQMAAMNRVGALSAEWIGGDPTGSELHGQ
jgi:hypothetical protein